MKLSVRDAPRLWAAPPSDWAGVLLYGADPMRVALKRAEAVAALTGPGAEAEMRLARLQGTEVRRDPASLADAVRAQGFFPGPRAVVLEDASDTLTPVVRDVLADWRAGDARLVATAGQLKPTSSLRKLFEGHTTAHALPLYDDPPGREEVEAMLRAAAIPLPVGPAMEDLLALARSLEPGDLRQTIEKLALYRLGDDTPPGPEDIAACAPASVEAALDEALHCAAEGRAGDLAPLLRRLAAQGVTPVALAIGAGRHFRQLHAAAANPARGLAEVRNFRARDRMTRQLRQWTTPRLESALSVLLEADLTLRSSSRAPAMALMERALIRVAMLGRPRQER
ncbi:MAG: DNA polymerase III subunit delta [Alkalilacustris sp.]